MLLLLQRLCEKKLEDPTMAFPTVVMAMFSHFFYMLRDNVDWKPDAVVDIQVKSVSRIP
ncbi:hypothetical protein IWW47_004714, partial [Coemansia sp. RSA 2052]